jgi:hypothetical protein
MEKADQSKDKYYETEDSSFAAYLFSRGFDFRYVRKNPDEDLSYYYGFNWKHKSPRGVIEKDLKKMEKEFNTKKVDLCQHCYTRCLRHVIELENWLLSEDDVDIKKADMICGHDLNDDDIPSRN